MSRTWAVRTVGSALLLLFVGCGAGGVPDGGGLEGPSIVIEPTAVIGEIEGDPDYLFGDIRSVAVDDAGIVYVGDRIGASVKAYSPTGEFLAVVAREGEGPGELQGWPANLAFGPGGRLYVRDASRVTVFARSGDGDPADSLADLWRMPTYGNLTYSRSRVGSDGTYYYPDGAFRPGDRPRVYFHVFRDGEATGDTVEVPFHPGLGARRSAFYPLGEGDGRMVDGLSHVPFATVPSWEVTLAGTILSTGGGTATLLETTPRGDTLRVLDLPTREARPIPTAERAESLAALESRIDSLPVSLDEVMNLGADIAERRLPDFLPMVLAVRMDMAGRIWVERWPPEGSPAVRAYDVYDGSGRHLTAVRLRAPLLAEPPPFFGRSAVVGVVSDPESGVHRVVVFALDELTLER